MSTTRRRGGLVTRKWYLEQDPKDPIVKRQRGALIVITVAICLDVLMGWLWSIFQHTPVWIGLYWAEGEATTVGSRFESTTPGGEIVKAIVGITVIPLFAATFSIFTTALTAMHVKHAEHRLKQHLVGHEERIKEHITKATGGNDG